MNVLPRLRPGLLKHPLDSQVLVYDPRQDRVHLLDRTTACVMDLLEEEGWTPEGIAMELSERLGIALNPGFLALAIQELRNADLLEQVETDRSESVEVNRREVLKTIAVAGTAAVLIPTIATLTATRGYAITSAQKGLGTACSGNQECIQGHCCGSGPSDNANAGNCGPSCPLPNGAACRDSTQCAPPLTCNNGFCGAPCALLPTGGDCTTSASSCSTAQTSANAKCCSGTCNGTCPTGGGSTKTWTGTCA